MVVDIRLGWKKRVLLSIARASVRCDRERRHDGEHRLVLRLHIKPGKLQSLPGDIVMDDLTVYLTHENKTVAFQTYWKDREGSQFTAILQPVREDPAVIPSKLTLSALRGFANSRTIHFSFSQAGQVFDNSGSVPVLRLNEAHDES
ncbi:hypothetical protein COX00_01910 [Candidatus Uhrbacteria bacterium CG22_combo_CG10-13_8_21_14_all_47_17]|uniref:Uncharacterized protein n=1 Tax=Candidatus Uhrbacteria bacterium CG22_combo_CG10-13_8_21_14_all_47_17 TaxID=1975041 RepID=A0A2H0BSN6_9BACT|nr:MAG: hypothetical protein COX00_01910 [Candidatus Uhrbacteria bacterium CG22_combo_CG10-13_8_21_14_all_47_17]